MFALAAAALASTAVTQAEPAEARRVTTPFGPTRVLHDQPEADAAKYTLWLAYADDRGEYQDHRQYLEDLQVRWQPKGVAIALVLSPDAAKRVAAGQPRFVVATTGRDLPAAAETYAGTSTTTVMLFAGDEMLHAQNGLDGAVDVLNSCIEDGADVLGNEQCQQLDFLVGRIPDGGDYGDDVQRSLALWPRSGRAHAAEVLFHWWCDGDLAAARKAVDAGIDALSRDSVPMIVFADLVLRGDRSDPSVAKKLAVAMAPAAAAAPDGVFTQLVHLRALLRAGQDRVAGRIIATLPKQLEGRTYDQIVFAEALMEGETPAAYRDIAQRALTAAEKAASGDSGFGRLIFGARHKVLKRCGDEQAAAKLMVEYRQAAGQGRDLNNDAWYLIVQTPTMGRFDTLALAQAQELERQTGDRISSGNKDTVALAYFVNGFVDKAVELQTDAAEQSGNQAVYVARLTRFVAAQRELAERRESGGDKK
jgi:hypothetical protein